MSAASGGRLAALTALLGEAADSFVELPILQPAEIFVELAGEDLRRRMFTVSGPGGEELCLRPEFTIPTCLKHLAERPAGGAPAAYAYLGPIFRAGRRSGAPEFLQAGLEWIGHEDTVATDARLVRLALEAAAALGLAKPRVRIGDADLFAAVVARLPLAAPWRAKLVAAFGHAGRLERTLHRLSEAPASLSAAEALGRALGAVNPADARAIVEAVVGMPEVAPFGGRSSAEIAERILEQGALGRSEEAAAAVGTIRAWLALETPLERAEKELETLANSHGISLNKALVRFVRRVEAMTAEGLDPAAATFAAGFGRGLDYYTGFQFELDDPARPELGPLIGGGRYDRLLRLLGASEDVPAIGFSVWLDRFGIPAPGAAR